MHRHGGFGRGFRHGHGLRLQLAHTLTQYWPVVVATVVAVPVAAAVATWLARRRVHRGWARGWAARSAFAEVLMIVGTLPSLGLTLTPDGRERGVNLVPFRDLDQQIHTGLGYATVQITGNLLVFAALGFGLPMRWRVGPLTALVVGACASAVIESSQWVLDIGRFSSVDDVLVNAVGAMLFAVLSRPWWRRRRPDRKVTTGDLPDPAETARSVP